MRGATYKSGEKIPTTFGSNLRTLIALGDTRYALLPVEVLFARKGTEQKVVLRMALVDGRSGLFVWAGDIVSDATTALTPDVIRTLAARVADLVVAR